MTSVETISNDIGHRSRRVAASRSGGGLSWIDRLAARLESGYLLIVDYGYTTKETTRFPQGTLRSYQRHRFLAPAFLDNPETAT